MDTDEYFKDFLSSANKEQGTRKFLIAAIKFYQSLNQELINGSPEQIKDLTERRLKIYMGHLSEIMQEVQEITGKEPHEIPPGISTSQRGIGPYSDLKIVLGKEVDTFNAGIRKIAHKKASKKTSRRGRKSAKKFQG